MWMPRRRPPHNDSIPRLDNQRTQRRVTSGGSIILRGNHTHRMLGGDPASDFDESFGDSTSRMSHIDIFDEEELVKTRRSVIGALPPVQNTDNESLWQKYVQLNPQDRDAAITKFNEITMQEFDEESWKFD